MLAPCYLVHGGESLQTEEIILEIRSLASKHGYNNYVVFELNTQAEWGELLNQAQSLDLFAERIVMELRLPGDSVSKQGNLMLETVLHQQDSNLCIIVRAAKLKSQVLSSNWAMYIQKNGKIKLAKPIPSFQWPTWISKRLSQAGFEPTKEAVTCLAKCYEGNLHAAVQCINKIATVLPPGSIDLNQIMPFVENNTHFSIFELINAALDGDSERTFSIFNNLKDDGIDPVLILWGVTKEIRTLLKLSHALLANDNLEQHATKLGVWRENLPRVKKTLQRLPTHKLEQLLHIAKNIDTNIKGMQPGDAWQSLMSMYLALSGNQTLIMEDLYT